MFINLLVSNTCNKYRQKYNVLSYKNQNQCEIFMGILTGNLSIFHNFAEKF